MRSIARVIAAPAAPGRSGVRLRVVESAPPLAVRRTGPAEISLLSTAAFPVGGDDVTLEVVVEAGATLTVRSVAAAIAYPGAHADASRLSVMLRVAAGGTLVWRPSPLVAAHGCRHHGLTSVVLDHDARLWWREDVRLGRSGESPGSLHQSLRIERDGRPLLHNETWLGPGWPGRVDQLAAPIAGHDVRAIGTGVLVAPDAGAATDGGDGGGATGASSGPAGALRGARFALADDAVVWTAVGPSLGPVDEWLTGAMSGATLRPDTAPPSPRPFCHGW